MSESELVDSVVGVCTVLASGLNVTETVQRLGAALSEISGRVRFTRPGWTEAELKRWQRGDAVSHVDLVPAEKLSLAALQARFGAFKEIGQLDPFQPPRVEVQVTFPDLPFMTRLVASLSRDAERKPDGYVSMLMLLPTKKS